MQRHTASTSGDDAQRLTGLDIVDHDHPRTGGDRRVRAFTGPLDETDEVGVRHFREMPLFDGEALMDLDRRPDAVSPAGRIRHGVAGPE